MDLKLPIFKNKNNGQCTIFLPKNQINFLKKNSPKFIKIKDFEFME